MFFLAVAAGAYATLVGAVYLGQRRIIYPVPKVVVEPNVPDASLETIVVPDAEPVVALHFRAPAGGRTLVHFHGNGEQLGDLVALGRAFRTRRLGFFAVEYPGYGLAPGGPSETSNYRAAEAAILSLEREHGIAPGDLVLQGQSLGTGVAVEMARRGHGRKLILISPYTSMVAMGKLTLPIFPNDWLLRDRYLNDDKAAQIRQPSLVIHGSDDEVIPASMGRRIAELLPDARLLIREGGHHNDLFVHGGRELVDTIAEFSAS